MFLFGPSAKRRLASQIQVLLVVMLTTLALCAPAQAALDPAELAVLESINATAGGGEIWPVGAGGSDPCADRWPGVTCDVTGTHVTELHLYSSPRLSGTLPDISPLKKLQVLHAYNNTGLTGEIPPLSGLINLRSVNFSFTRMTGPIPSLSGLTKLEEFIVVTSRLTGSVPDLSGLTALHTFYVADNRLTGSIPPLRDLPALRMLILSANQLTGSIPSLSELPALESLSLFSNQLSGPVPIRTPTLIGAALCPNFLTLASDPPSAK